MMLSAYFFLTCLHASDSHPYTSVWQRISSAQQTEVAKMLTYCSKIKDRLVLGVILKGNAGPVSCCRGVFCPESVPLAPAGRAHHP